MHPTRRRRQVLRFETWRTFRRLYMPRRLSFPRANNDLRVTGISHDDKTSELCLSTMAETPMSPFNPFADSPSESTTTTPCATANDVESMTRRLFSFTPPAAPSPAPVPDADSLLSSIRIRSHFQGPTGSLYTAGLNAQGFPELMAQGVPRHRSPLVVKNMYFLARRLLQGIPVRAGHRSTDHDYRVSIVSGPSHTLTLIPFYHDCEEWGSFPPAPQQDRMRRNRLLAAAWFPTDQDMFDEADATYLVENVEHFARLLHLPDLARINAALPISLQQLISGNIASRRTSITTTIMPPESTSSSTTTTTE